MHRLAVLIALYGTKVLSVVSAVVITGMLAYSGIVLYDTVYTNRAAFSSWDLTQYRPEVTEDEEPSFEELQEVNKDTRAWLIMKGTHIDYPVVQGKDDVEYSMKDIYGKSSLTGSIYLASANNGDFTDSFNMIYGHHMDNGAMFGDIEKYEDDSYFREHGTGYLITTKGVYDLRVFARLTADAYDAELYSAGDRQAGEFPEYLNYVKSKAVQWDPSFDAGQTADSIGLYLSEREKSGGMTKRGTQLIALSTCADASTNGRQLLVATMTPRTEPLPEELFIDDAVPLAVWGHGEADHWALLNLICTIMCIIVLLPLRQIRNKYRSIRKEIKETFQKEEREELEGLEEEDREAREEREKLKRQRNRRLIGVMIQLIVTAFAIFWFIWTEDPRQPMVIIDRWTLLMIVLFAITWFVDVYLIKYRYRKRQEEEEDPEVSTNEE